jgi:hypothetical protein
LRINYKIEGGGSKTPLFVLLIFVLYCDKYRPDLFIL